jgi:hypothetical protein
MSSGKGNKVSRDIPGRIIDRYVRRRSRQAVSNYSSIPALFPTTTKFPRFSDGCNPLIKESRPGDCAFNETKTRLQWRRARNLADGEDYRAPLLFASCFCSRMASERATSQARLPFFFAVLSYLARSSGSARAARLAMMVKETMKAQRGIILLDRRFSYAAGL